MRGNITNQPSKLFALPTIVLVYERRLQFHFEEGVGIMDMLLEGK